MKRSVRVSRAGSPIAASVATTALFDPRDRARDSRNPRLRPSPLFVADFRDPLCVAAVVSKSVVAKMPAMPKKAALSSAVAALAAQALPALAVVDERLNGDGTGLIFGVNDESLGFILLTVPTLIFGLYYVANTTDANIMSGGKDDDSGLSL